MAAKRKKKQKPEKASAEEGGGRSKQDQNDSFKRLLAVLLVLNVAAGGFYGYLTLVKSKNAKQELRSNENRLQALKQLAVTVQEEAARVTRDKVQEVKVPTELVLRVANDLKIRQFIEVRGASRSSLKGSKLYNVVRVPIRFIQKQGFKLEDLHVFLNSLEKANPKVQVTRISMPERDDPRPNGDVFWRPSEAEVRVFVPRDATNSSR